MAIRTTNAYTNAAYLLSARLQCLPCERQYEHQFVRFPPLGTWESVSAAEPSDSHYDVIMRTLSASQAKTQFGQMIDRVQKAPVQLTRRGRVAGVMVSARDCEDMRSFYANRLMHTLHSTAVAAQVEGLTQRKLTRLLGDES